MLARCFLALIAAGCSGDPLTSLIRFGDEPAGDNCSAGGQRVEGGVDADGSGVLDDDEVTETTYVCNGEDGEAGEAGEAGDDGDDGAPTLIEITDIAPGGACGTTTGIRVRTGVDDDRDGVLDENEVEATETLCDGADGSDGSDGTSTLIATTPIELPSATCPQGGVLVETGHDDDGDHVLDPEEVDASEEVCAYGDGAGLGPVLTGNYLVLDELDVAMLTGVRVIDGDLTFAGSLNSISLPALEAVTGAIQVLGFANYDLSALTTAGALLTQGPGQVEAPELDTIGVLSIGYATTHTFSSLRVANTIAIGAASSTAFPALEELGELQVNGPLASLPSIGTVTSVEKLHIENCPNLTSLSPLSGLTAIGTSLELRHLPQITSLDALDDVTTVGDVRLEDLPIADVDAFDGVTTMGSLTLSDLPSLSSVAGLADLTSVTGSLSLDQLALLASLSGLDDLDTLGTLSLVGLPLVTSLAPLAGLTSVTDQVSVTNLPITTLDPLADLTTTPVWSLNGLPGVTSLEPLDGLTEVADFAISGMAATSLAPLAGMTITNSVSISAMPITSLDGLTGLTTTAALLVTANPSLTDIDALAYVTRLRGLSLGGPLPDLDGLAGLVEVEEFVELDVTGSCTLALPELASVGGSLISFTECTRIELPSLATAEGIFVDAPSLEYLDLGALGELDANFTVFTGSAFPTCHAWDVVETLESGGWTGTPTVSGGTDCEAIDWCRLQSPTGTTEPPSAAVAYYGRLYIDGLTTDTTGVDGSPVLRAAAGVGDADSDPATDASWSWFAASGTPDWNGSTSSEPNNDEYTASLTAPAQAGSYHTAFRFSGDGGRTWTYCDRNVGAGSDGAEDGYQVANAGTLTVAP